VAAAPIPVIYGGSVDPAGAGPLLAEPGVDGLFVGRAALDPVAFAEIVHTPLGPARPA
jgi:triosephosphate isomerase